jgi:hypothetical protein
MGFDQARTQALPEKRLTIMIRAVPAKERFHDDDIGPDPDMDLELGGPVEFTPDFELVFEVWFRGDRQKAVQQFADDQGISFDDAVHRLVDEALAAHPQPRR